MADKSAIEWTDATWTPIRARYLEIQNDGSGKERIGWHCEHASEGCRFCYAEGFNRRLGTGLDFKPGELYREEKRGYNNGEVKLFLDEEMLTAPLRWKKPRMIFVCSMTDLFAEFVPDEWIDKVFAIMALSPQHTFQVLTKRANRMREYMAKPLTGPWAGRATIVGDDGIERPDTDAHWRVRSIQTDMLGSVPGDALNKASAFNDKLYGGEVDGFMPTWPLPNVWLGVSAERQQEADQRVPELLATPAAVRFVSAEPLLGPIDFKKVKTQDISDPLDALRGEGYCDINHGQYAGQRLYHGLKYGCGRGLDWIIVGGESGPSSRPMHPDWARSIRDQCLGAGVPFFFKQWGEFAPARTSAPPSAADIKQTGDHPVRVGKKAAGRLLDGIEHNAMPEAR
ncbi:phage Gp37/Gp68 family protein [Mesorhizobium sp.]|uniref:DUF5131 family protein n=1 Tax=Mesorhizobium sp. TaxID=1871066 RepID=UPI00122285DD|nr:phage Gp37/Gp68 family protein [Mesorhizobium sp.]TIM07562.1 MAG: phage Gp37/Gp68 family protein [Mesorhizobium sp.]